MTNNEKIYNLAKKYEFDECRIISIEPFFRYQKDLDYDNYGDVVTHNFNPNDYKDDCKYIIVMIKSYKPFDKAYFTKDHIYVDAYYVAGNKSYFNAKNMTEEIQSLGHTAHFPPRISYRHAAFRAGYGKRGMNAQLMNERYGSYMHIQCIMTDMPLKITHDEQTIRTCSKCNLCIDACPANAMDGTGRVELKGCTRHYMPARRYVPVEVRHRTGSKFIGCTYCREVCPANNEIEDVKPPDDLLDACYIPILIDKEHELHRKHLKVLQDYLGKNEVRPLKLLKSVVIIVGNVKDSKYLDILYKIKDRETDKDILEYVDWAIDEMKEN